MDFPSFSERIAYVSRHPRELPRVVVLYGGESNERAISIESGQAVVQGLREGNIEVVDYEVTSWQSLIADLPHFKTKYQCDVVFNLIHGGAGEDGALHALLDMLSLPYVGSDHVASVLAMNKTYCKKIWSDLALNVPASCSIGSIEELECLSLPQFPVIVKPADEGSSNGITKVEQESELREAVLNSLKYSSKVLIERFIQGNELTVAIIDGQALTPIEIKPSSGIYDYHAKYVAEDTEFFCPPKHIAKELFPQIYTQALVAYKALGARHWGRIDFIIDEYSKVWILEVNLIPGMTSHSLVPQAAWEQGWSFSQLVCALVTLPLKSRY